MTQASLQPSMSAKPSVGRCCDAADGRPPHIWAPVSPTPTTRRPLPRACSRSVASQTWMSATAASWGPRIPSRRTPLSALRRSAPRQPRHRTSPGRGPCAELPSISVSGVATNARTTTAPRGRKCCGVGRRLPGLLRGRATRRDRRRRSALARRTRRYRLLVLPGRTSYGDSASCWR